MIDTHCHILPKFGYLDTDTIIQNANKAGVTKMISIGCDYEDIEETIKLSEKYKGIIFASLGLHPECVKLDSNIDEMFEKFKAIIQNNLNKIIAIGECGLDYHFSNDPIIHNKQKKLFKKQIELCIDIQKPLIIHTRDAWEDTFNLLDQTDFKNKQLGYFEIKDTNTSQINKTILIETGIVHSFTGGILEANESIKRGFKLGINGIITFKNSNIIREAVKSVGIGHVVFETDSPFLSPEPFRGQTNEPARVKEIAEFVKKLLDI